MLVDSSSRLRARLWFARHAPWLRRLGGIAQALLISGGGSGRGAQARTAIGLGLSLVDGVAELLGREPQDAVDGWSIVSDGWHLRHVIDHALGPAPEEEGIFKAHQHVVAGRMVLRTVSHIYVDGPEAAVVEALAAQVWARLGPRLTLTRGGANDRYLDVRAETRTVRHTAQGRALVDLLRPYLDAGRRPSLLMHGEPGTGKTTAITEAAEALGSGRTLVVDAGVLNELPVSDLRPLLGFLRPEVFVVDDLDRHHDPGALLALFDDSPARVRVAAVNSLGPLPVALRRPGRFNLRVCADDPEALDARLSDARVALAPVWAHLDAATLAEVELWPIAYVAALVERLEVTGSARLGRYLDELRGRLREQREANNDPPPMRRDSLALR